MVASLSTCSTKMARTEPAKTNKKKNYLKEGEQFSKFKNQNRWDVCKHAARTLSYTVASPLETDNGGFKGESVLSVPLPPPPPLPNLSCQTAFMASV